MVWGVQFRVFGFRFLGFWGLGCRVHEKKNVDRLKGLGLIRIRRMVLNTQKGKALEAQGWGLGAQVLEAKKDYGSGSEGLGLV